MPCNSDYMESTEVEKNSKEVAELIEYIVESGIIDGWHRPETVEPYLKAASENYGNPELLDEMTAFLCKVLSNFNEHQLETIVYNGRNKMSRRLADWWDAHQAADKARRAKEAEEFGDSEDFEEDIEELYHELTGRIVDNFIETFLRAMDNDEYPTYRVGLEEAQRLAKNRWR